jgi:phospholipase D1/2
MDQLAWVSAWIEPHRHEWYALPVVMATFCVLGLSLVPVLLLITATGAVFGPVLGPIYAMAGSLASASLGFALGRWLGHDRVARFGGARVAMVTRALRRNGTLAVFLVRKVPAPFMLVNVVIGASTVRYSDFVLGTLLGMMAIVIALAGFARPMAETLSNPTPSSVLTALLFVAVPLTMAWLINRSLRRARAVE